MPEVKASELVQELTDKWREVLDLIKLIKCPFVEELKERTGIDCLIDSVCEKCLANYHLCKEYMQPRSNIRVRVFNLINLLVEHYVVYQRHEK